MLIVNQDRNRTTESIELTIEANTVERGNFPTTTIEITGYYILDRKNGIVLGEYKTKERTQEVYDEIIERYENWEYMKVGQPSGICNPVYKMPEE